jgi:TRAP-type mannitol/chloroaromatic compound transport system permease small subunit
MRGLLRGVDNFSEFLGLAVGQFYLVCAVITVYEVVMRYVFGAPTAWAFEMVMALCATAWLLSVGYVTRHKRHIGITVLYVMAPPRVQWWMDLFAMVMAFLAASILAYACYGPAKNALGYIERSGSAFNSPEPVILKTLLVVAATLYAVQQLSNIIQHFRGASAHEPDAHVDEA